MDYNKLDAAKNFAEEIGLQAAMVHNLSNAIADAKHYSSVFISTNGKDFTDALRLPYTAFLPMMHEYLANQEAILKELQKQFDEL